MRGKPYLILSFNTERMSDRTTISRYLSPYGQSQLCAERRDAVVYYGRKMVMKKFRITALIIAAAAGLQGFAGCGKKKGINVSGYAEALAESATAPAIGGEELSGENYDTEKYYDKISEAVQNAEKSQDPPKLGTLLSEVITPEEGAKDYALGSYRVSSRGTKMYFDDSQFDEKLMLTLEAYFDAFSAADFTTYSQCIFPSYSDEMETFLSKDYSYDLKTSFTKQCSGIADRMNGDYRITRIKVEPAPQYKEGEDNIANYYKSLDEIFGKDYYGQVKEESDSLIDASFYIMAENSAGQEEVIVGSKNGGYEIVFAKKGDRYYTFG